MGAPLERDRSVLVERLATLDRARSAWGESGATTLDTGLTFRPGEPVEVRVVKRLHRYAIDDAGGAVRSAGRPRGWLERAGEVVEETGLNVSRRGVVFVGAVEGRDIASLAVLVAETSVAVHTALLDLEDEAPARR